MDKFVMTIDEVRNMPENELRRMINGKRGYDVLMNMDKGVRGEIFKRIMPKKDGTFLQRMEYNEILGLCKKSVASYLQKRIKENI